MPISKKQNRFGRAINSGKETPSVDYRDHLLRELEDPQYAAGYLTAALEEGEEVFLLALRDVAQAKGGLSGLAKATKLNRENLYAMLSKDGNPRLSSVATILKKLGMQLQFAPTKKSEEAA